MVEHILDNGMCVTCSVQDAMSKHVFDNGVCVSCSHAGATSRRFDPHQPRDPGGEDGGQWVKSPVAEAAGAAAKALKKAAKSRRGSQVRAELHSAQTIPEINGVIAAEIKKATGRDVHVDLAGSDPQVAREFGEGVLRSFERYPKAQIAAIQTHGPGTRRPGAFGPGDSSAVAYNDNLGGTHDVISLNTHFAGNPRRFRLAATKADRTGFSPAGVSGPMGVAVHEFGHSLGRHTGADEQAGAVMALRGGRDVDREIRREIGHYAATNDHELVAEAFADVVLNGDGASKLSREIAADVIDFQYRRTYGEDPK